MQIVTNDRFRFHLRAVVEHIATHLDCPPRLGALATLARMSTFHFLRVYAHYMGETPMATSRRLRMKHAWTLLNGGLAVREVAGSTGYGSSQAFSNAFRDHFGMSPSRVPKFQGFPAVPPHIERIIANPTLSIPYRGSMPDAVMAFDELFKLMHRASGRVDLGQVYAVVHDAPDLDPCRTFALSASVVTNLRVKGVNRSTLPGGAYVVVRSRGAWPQASRDDVDRVLCSAHAMGFERAAAPLLARPVLDPYRTAPADRMWEVLYPLHVPARRPAHDIE